MNEILRVRAHNEHSRTMASKCGFFVLFILFFIRFLCHAKQNTKQNELKTIEHTKLEKHINGKGKNSWAESKHNCKSGISKQFSLNLCI